MALNLPQFRDLIERTLDELDPELNTPVAVKLLLGTAAQESQFGTFIRQKKGPALGVFQIEPITFVDIRDRFKGKYPVLAHRTFVELEWDLKLSIIIARLKYRSYPSPLPEDDMHRIAAYWKLVYNTPLGKGSEQQFVDNYVRHVGFS